MSFTRPNLLERPAWLVCGLHLGHPLLRLLLMLDKQCLHTVCRHGSANASLKIVFWHIEQSLLPGYERTDA